MNQLQKIIVPILRAVAVSADSSINEIGSFADSGLAGWIEKSFEGKTESLLAKDAGIKVLQARSNGSASGMVFEAEYNPQDYPVFAPVD